MAIPTHCSACRDPLVEQMITHSVPVGEEMFEIENVPALKCLRCGETWIDDLAMETIERIVKENRA